MKSLRAVNTMNNSTKASKQKVSVFCNSSISDRAAVELISIKVVHGPSSRIVVTCFYFILFYLFIFFLIKIAYNAFFLLCNTI